MGPSCSLLSEETLLSMMDVAGSPVRGAVPPGPGPAGLSMRAAGGGGVRGAGEGRALGMPAHPVEGVEFPCIRVGFCPVFSLVVKKGCWRHHVKGERDPVIPLFFPGPAAVGVRLLDGVPPPPDPAPGLWFRRGTGCPSGCSSQRQSSEFILFYIIILFYILLFCYSSPEDSCLLVSICPDV